jgi:hypothetical protein
MMSPTPIFLIRARIVDAKQEGCPIIVPTKHGSGKQESLTPVALTYWNDGKALDHIAVAKSPDEGSGDRLD